MKTKDTRRKSSLCRFILPLIAIASIMLIISFALPYESRGGGGGGSRGGDFIELKEEGGIKGLEDATKLKIVYFRAEIASLAVKAYDGVYVGEAWMQNLNKDDNLGVSFVAIIPSNRVQRMFEVAVARGLPIRGYGYKVPSPEDHWLAGLEFYRITSAELHDPDVTINAVVEEP